MSDNPLYLIRRSRDELQLAHESAMRDLDAAIEKLEAQEAESLGERPEQAAPKD